MHSRLENNKDLIVLLKNNGYRDDLIDFILNLNDENFKSLKENFSENKDLLTVMSGKKYSRASEYILDKFYNIKTNDGKYSFSEDENTYYFHLYKEFIIILLNQEFSDDHLLQILNQLSFHVDRVNQGYHIDHPGNPIGHVHAYGGHMGFNEHFLEYKDVFTTFFRYFPSHSHSYDYACKALTNIDYSELDKYQSNLPLFRLLVQNGFLCRVIEREYMTVKNEYRDHFRMMHDDFFHHFHHNPRSGIVDSLFSMADYKTLNINNNNELLDLLLEKNLVTFDQGKKDFVTGNPIVSYLLKAGNLTVSELINNSLREIKEKLVKSIIKVVQAQSNLPNKHPAKGSELAEQVIGKLRSGQNEVPSLLTLSIDKILNPQVEKARAPQEKQQNRWCSIL